MLEKENAEIKRRKMLPVPEERTQSSPEGMPGQDYAQRNLHDTVLCLTKTEYFIS